MAPAALASGGSGGGGSGGTGGGGTKPPCTTALSVAGAATEALTGNAFSATYTLVSCQSKTKVGLAVTDLSNGALVYSVPDLIGTTAVWTLPYKLTSYRIDARAYSGQTGATLTTATTTVDTLNALPCQVFVAESATVGYYLTYPAIWASTNVQSCGLPNSRVRLRITNLSSSVVEYDAYSYSSSYLTDYEGPAVSYGTPYEIEADLVSSTGDVLSTSLTAVTSAPLR